MKGKLVFVFSLLAVLSGCATRYQPQGFLGGYSEVKLTPDSFVVSFNGNQFTSTAQARNYALRRASELTLQQGYQYFVISSYNDESRQTFVSNTTSNGSGSQTYYNDYTVRSSTHTTASVINRPSISLVVKCFQDKPERGDVVDARYFLDHNN